MYKRRVFTVDPQYFPLSRMREIVSYLHSHDQQYSMSQRLGVRWMLAYYLSLLSFNDGPCCRVYSWSKLRSI